MRLKTRIAIRMAKITSFVIKKMNRGSGVTLPGKIAHMIDKDILRELSQQVKNKTVATMGTNGKTTTNSLLYHVLAAEGHEVIINRTGANMLNGIISAFVLATNHKGQITADYACIEVDEMASVAVLPQLMPDGVVLTNISRDQLDRFGEVDITLNKLIQAFKSVPQTRLAINADDMMSVCMAEEAGNDFITYGIDEEIFDTTSKSEIRESIFCRKCGTKMEYQFFHYGQLGLYSCPGCGFKRPRPDYLAHDIRLDGEVYSFSLNELRVDTTSRTPYNVYNTLSAYALLKGLDIEAPHFKETVEDFSYENDREVLFHIGDTRVQLHLAKNPVGFQQKVSLVLRDEKEKDVIIQINDGFQDGRDISWLWDVDFQYLQEAKACSLVCLGTRRYDMALRLKYEDVAYSVADSMEEAVRAALRSSAKNLYIIVNYTGLYETKGLLERIKKEAE
ncbi:UDP-N-acetylmuramyl tripeptide synthase [Lachnospiraceae bacterium PF1-21]|uniref:MurT ligase domain-containing protein n=1 Tax=Ohessyouella blattaphilus TaxID=2949333 RepID=UPI003E221BCC